MFMSEEREKERRKTSQQQLLADGEGVGERDMERRREYCETS